jgi:hypothetical protein
MSTRAEVETMNGILDEIRNQELPLAGYRLNFAGYIPSSIGHASVDYDGKPMRVDDMKFRYNFHPEQRIANPIGAIELSANLELNFAPQGEKPFKLLVIPSEGKADYNWDVIFDETAKKVTRILEDKFHLSCYQSLHPI